MDSGLGLRPRRNDSVSMIEGEIEIFPVGVHFLDQPDLPVAAPLLELLLASDGFRDLIVGLVSDEAGHAVLRRKVVGKTLFMPENSARQIIRDARIQSAVAAAGEHVDVVRHAKKKAAPRPPSHQTRYRPLRFT